jgi:membrane-associated protease RseP (regulator of RpoE activity)
VLYALGVIIFALGLLLSIALHEVGHMVPAKKFGVKVTQYMVGFGPTLWSRKKGDTEYGLKAIPAGGYIRMIGMVPPRAAGRPSRWPRRLASAVEDFRRVSRAEIEPGDEPREFYRLTPGKKMIVMLGGPSMNLLIYLVLTLILLTTLGLVHDDPTRTVASVFKCVEPANATAAQQKQASDCTTPNAPAYQAGLRPGDVIESINGTTTTSWAAATTIIEASPHKTLSMVIQRGGRDLTLAVTPVDNLKYVTDTKLEVAGFIGVSPGDHHYYKPLGITQVPGQVVSQVALGLRAIGSYPSKIHSLWQTVFEGKKRDPNGAVGVVGIGRLGGDVARSNLLDLQDKIYTLVGLLASVNLLLFFFNLLPLLPLDGGHVAGAIVEAAKRGRARLRARSAGVALAGASDHDGPEGRPKSQIFVDTAQMLPVMYAVGSVLLLLTLLTLYADIVKPINLGG